MRRWITLLAFASTANAMADRIAHSIEPPARSDIVGAVLVDTLPSRWAPGFERRQGGDSAASLLGTFQGDLIAVGGYSSIGSIVRLRNGAWESTGAPSVLDVRAITEFAGQLIVSDAGRVRAWNGSTWTLLGGNAGDSDKVLEFGVYAGELFASYFASGVKRWTGTTWAAIGAVSGGTPSSKVEELCEYDGKLIAAGRFTQMAGMPANNIAAWDGMSWSPLGSGLEGLDVLVTDAVVFDGHLFVAGEFEAAGGQPVPRDQAQWDGTSWTPSFDGYSKNLVVAGTSLYGTRGQWVAGQWISLGMSGATFPSAYGAWNDTFVLWGQFPDVAGRSAFDAVSYDAGVWRRVSPIAGYGFDSQVDAMVVYRDTLIVAGGFSSAGSVAAPLMAKWDGAAMWPFPIPITQVLTMRVFDGDLIVGGSFGTQYGIPFNNIARWDGSTWHPLGTGLPVEFTVRALAEYNGELIAGGGYGGTGDPLPGGVARWDGSQWRALGDGSIEYVRSFALHDGKLIACSPRVGEFEGELAAWDGTQWTALGNGLRASGVISLGDDLFARSIVLSVGGPVSLVQWDGSQWNYVAPPSLSGQFGEFRGQLLFRHFLRSPAGWVGLSSGPSGAINAWTQYNGNLYAAGAFNRAGGRESINFARWDADTTPIEVEMLRAHAAGGIVHLEWTLSIEAVQALRAVCVQRAIEAEGPYTDRSASLEPMRTMTYQDESGGSNWYRLVLVGRDGSERLTGPVFVPKATGGRTSLQPASDHGRGPLPLRFEIGPRATPTRLVIHDVRGRVARVLVDEFLPAGSHVATWDRRDGSGRRVARGVYFLRLEAAGTVATQKLILTHD